MVKVYRNKFLLVLYSYNYIGNYYLKEIYRFIRKYFVYLYLVKFEKY